MVAGDLSAVQAGDYWMQWWCAQNWGSTALEVITSGTLLKGKLHVYEWMRGKGGSRKVVRAEQGGLGKGEERKRKGGVGKWEGRDRVVSR